MKVYLRWINPAIALTILALCTWASMTDKEEPHLAGIVSGGFGSYFFAKGLFCSSALFLTGFSVLHRVESAGKGLLYGKRDVGIIAVLTLVLVGGLVGFYAKAKADDQSKAIQDSEPVQNPSTLVILNVSPIPASEFLCITGKIQNRSTTRWSKVILGSEIFHGDTYSGEVNATIESLKPNEERRFILQSSSLRTDKILDSLHFKIHTKASP